MIPPAVRQRIEDRVGGPPPFDPYKCPSCNSRLTLPRHGVGFEHERRCQACQQSYDPQTGYERYLVEVFGKHLDAEAERLSYNTHRD